MAAYGFCLHREMTLVRKGSCCAPGRAVIARGCLLHDSLSHLYTNLEVAVTLLISCLTILALPNQEPHPTAHLPVFKAGTTKWHANITHQCSKCSAWLSVCIKHNSPELPAHTQLSMSCSILRSPSPQNLIRHRGSHLVLFVAATSPPY